MRWAPKSADELLELHARLPRAGRNDFDLDCGQGNWEYKRVRAAKTLSCPAGGSTAPREIRLRGYVQQLQVGGKRCTPGAITVLKWGHNPWVSMKRMFAGCRRISIAARSAPELSQVRSLSGMFAGSGFNQDLHAWDVRNIRDMSHMFEDNLVFNQDLSSWNVAEVRTMEAMFHGAKAFNGELGSWNVDLLENSGRMFEGATSFNQDVTQWATFSLYISDRMFKGASSFHQDLSGWSITEGPGEDFAPGLSEEQLPADRPNE